MAERSDQPHHKGQYTNASVGKVREYRGRDSDRDRDRDLISKSSKSFPVSREATSTSSFPGSGLSFSRISRYEEEQRTHTIRVRYVGLKVTHRPPSVAMPSHECTLADIGRWTLILRTHSIRLQWHSIYIYFQE